MPLRSSSSYSVASSSMDSTASSSNEGEAMGAFLGKLNFGRLDLISDNAKIPHASTRLDRGRAAPRRSASASTATLQSRWDAAASAKSSSFASPIVRPTKRKSLDNDSSRTSPTTVTAALPLDHPLHIPRRRPSLKNLCCEDDGNVDDDNETVGKITHVQPPKWRSMPIPSRDSNGSYHYHSQDTTTISQCHYHHPRRSYLLRDARIAGPIFEDYASTNLNQKDRVERFLDEAIDMVSKNSNNNNKKVHQLRSSSTSSLIVDSRW